MAHPRHLPGPSVQQAGIPQLWPPVLKADLWGFRGVYRVLSPSSLPFALCTLHGGSAHCLRSHFLRARLPSCPNNKAPSLMPLLSRGPQSCAWQSGQGHGSVAKDVALSQQSQLLCGLSTDQPCPSLSLRSPLYRGVLAVPPWSACGASVRPRTWPVGSAPCSLVAIILRNMCPQHGAGADTGRLCISQLLWWQRSPLPESHTSHPGDPGSIFLLMPVKMAGGGSI